MNRLVSGMIWGSAIGVTAAVTAVSFMEPRVSRVIMRKGRQALKKGQKRLSNMMM